MSHSLNDVVVLEDDDNFYKTSINPVLRLIVTLHRCIDEGTYIDIYLKSENFIAQIIDIDLGAGERLGSEIARDIAIYRRSQRKLLAPIILISAFSKELEDIQREYPDDFFIIIWKNDPNFSEMLTNAVNQILTRDDDICEQLEDTVTRAIQSYANKHGKTLEEAEAIVMEKHTEIPADKFSGQGWADIDTIRKALADCKTEVNEIGEPLEKFELESRRSDIRQMVLDQLELLDRENIVSEK